MDPFPVPDEKPTSDSFPSGYTLNPCLAPPEPTNPCTASLGVVPSSK